MSKGVKCQTLLIPENISLYASSYTITNYGTIINNGVLNTGDAGDSASGVVNNIGGTIINNNIINNAFPDDVPGIISNNGGIINNNTGAVINNQGVIIYYNNGIINNQGVINNSYEIYYGETGLCSEGVFTGTPIVGTPAIEGCYY